MSGPTFVTIAIPFRQENIDAVNACLHGCVDPAAGNRPNADLVAALDALETLHFLSIVAVDTSPPEAAYIAERPPFVEGQLPAHLMLEMTSDCAKEEAISKLCGAIGGALVEILAAAGVGYGQSLDGFLGRHYVRIAAGWGAHGLGQVFSGSPGMGVWRIRRERCLAEWAAMRLDEHRRRDEWRYLSPRQRLDFIRAEAWNTGCYKWAFVEEAAPCLPSDPSNPWSDNGYNIHNPQALKALGYILRTFGWPAFTLLAALVVALAIGAHYRVLPWYSPWLGFVEGLLLLGWAAYRFQRQESLDPVDHRVPSSHQVDALMQVENFPPGTQNHMMTVSQLKPGFLRRLALRLAFVTVGSGPYVSAPGFLGNNGVIHAARWLRLPGTSQLLFWSNYDGTWESYVADFIADAPTGVTAIWSNCAGFPRTRWLFGGGAKDRDRLVQWARRQQQPTRFWYSGYPDLTTARIRNNAAIRQGLASALSDADARDWLSLFGSAPRPVDSLDVAEIPTLVFGALANRPHASCHVVQFQGDDPAATRRWLTTVAADVSYGQTPPGQPLAVAVALTSSGLSHLKVPEESLATFSPAFQQGMADPSRARELGDASAGEPQAAWQWGTKDTRADALVLVYASDEATLKQTLDQYAVSAAANCVQVVKELPLGPPPAGFAQDKAVGSAHKVFAFADGISQPVLRGAPRGRRRASSDDQVEPGEIVLGYPDNTGEMPSSPTLADHDDTWHYLPDVGADLARRRPEFSRYETQFGYRDLGANGTYLVVRQIEQVPGAIDRWLETQARIILDLTKGALPTADQQVQPLTSIRPLSTTPGTQADSPYAGGPPYADSEDLPENQNPPATTITPEQQAAFKGWLASRLIGRWGDGSSLVRNPLVPAAAADPNARPDNDFRLGTEDPRGLACPFGAHIRRANPRDTRFHDTKVASDDEIAAVNRHRILRVGRPYQLTGEGAAPEKGLLFMCLNADIERQFEFVQKTWLLNRNIHGLEDEVDPIIGRGKRNFTIPLPNGPLRLTIDESFVNVRGGEYFFMPGRAFLRYLAAERSAGPPVVPPLA